MKSYCKGWQGNLRGLEGGRAISSEENHLLHFRMWEPSSQEIVNEGRKAYDLRNSFSQNKEGVPSSQPMWCSHSGKLFQVCFVSFQIPGFINPEHGDLKLIVLWSQNTWVQIPVLAISRWWPWTGYLDSISHSLFICKTEVLCEKIHYTHMHLYASTHAYKETHSLAHSIFLSVASYNFQDLISLVSSSVTSFQELF